jgi:glycerol-3-phosphate dehydrogenase (NAD(P)+)
MHRIAIIGAGGWGTALGILAGRAGHQVRLWSRNQALVTSVNRERVNPFYLAGYEITGDVQATTEAGAAVRDAELVILAAPSHATRALLELLVEDVRAEVILVSAT